MTLADGYAQRENNFNLIRLVAAWLVIYGHAYAITGSTEQDLLLYAFQFKFAGGIAVDVFFLVSGFLIAASLERNGARAYLAARTLRIMPGLLACLLLCVLVLGPLATTADHYWADPQTWRYFWKNATLWENEWMLPGVFQDHPYKAVNGSLWTLGIEAAMYVATLVLGLSRLLRPARFNALFVTAAVLAFAAAGTTKLTTADSNHAYCTAFFFTGVFAWTNRDRVTLSWPILFGVLVFAASLSRTDRFYVGYYLAVSYGVPFLAFVPKLPVLQRTDLSYGLYLYGWPSEQLVRSVAPTWSPEANAAAATLIAAALAALSWRYVEKPALALKARFGARAAAHSVAAPAAAEARAA